MTPEPAVRRQSKITIAELNALREVGRHSVGDGLLLVVGSSGSRSWLARIRDATGRRRDIGLGHYPEITLKEAREKSAALRKQVRDGVDPVVAKRKAREVTRTFKEAAEEAHGERTAGFKNRKHAAQWITTLRDYAYPHFGNLPVNKVTGPMIVQAMKPIWSEKPETASIISVVDLRSLGPVRRSAVDEHLRHLAIVFWLTPWHLASALRLSLLCCVARRTTSVVVALPCKT